MDQSPASKRRKPADERPVAVRTAVWPHLASLTKNQLKDEDVPTFLAPASNWSGLSLRNNLLTHEGVVTLFEKLRHHPRITHLDIGGATLCDKYATELINGIRSSNVRELWIPNCVIHPDDMDRICAEVHIPASPLERIIVLSPKRSKYADNHVCVPLKIAETPIVEDLGTF